VVVGADPTITHLVPTGPALVLGSTQDRTTVDEAAAAAAGLAVVRRRSGGGAVLVGPADPLWVDVDLPRADPRWRDDVAESFRWLGRAWVGALADLGLVAEVHEGPYRPGRWGRAVCFAGVGPGEVLVAGAKAVGIAARRTRAGARFQCALATTADLGPLVDLVVAPDERDAARTDLAGAVHPVTAGPGVVLATLAAHLAAR